ncbi:substrate-binding domain-containing protein [Streptomyces coeruleorubidus]|uniref:Substrate-binding domain-containing protein n=1 Tax=Streptomyces coeruleorubidus TaxID=116188 RepID=A0ABZ0K7B4_STRC4|nr:substrate-binding domain-containing protein [Streptomyces coeruleorubidus]WOT33539.1 substrate-binding domain-containing protein [Streptomyces coeruleorubidus]
MRSRRWGLGAGLVAVVMAVSLAGCTEDGGQGEEGFTVGLLLPSRAVPRWEQSDKPLIEKRVKELCADCTIAYANAENDAASQRQQMNSMITRGVSVLILDVVDPKALRSSVRAADRAGIPVVAYDRLAEGPISGFVSFDGGRVGRLQGEALLKGMGAGADDGGVVMVNGDPSSPNAAWYEDGSRSVLQDKVRILKSYNTIGWRTENAHDHMSAAINALGPNRIDGVLAANDSIASGVIAALKSARVSPLPPVTGQDADLDAVRRIVKGEQYMTVYKPFRQETEAASAMAVALARGNDLDALVTTTVDSPTTKDVPAVLLDPVSVTAGTIGRTLVRDGIYTIDQICTPKLRSACDRAGLTR